MSGIADSWLIMTIVCTVSHNPHQAFTLRVLLEAATDRNLFRDHPDPCKCVQFAACKATEHIRDSPEVRRAAGRGSSLLQEVERVVECDSATTNILPPGVPWTGLFKVGGRPEGPYAQSPHEGESRNPDDRCAWWPRSIYLYLCRTY